MDRMLYHHVTHTPDAIAIMEGANQLTYAQLFTKSRRLAQVLQKMDITAEEPIGILLGPGIDLVVAELAVVLAQATCVPVEPSIPKMRIMSMFHDVGVKHAIAKGHDLEDINCITMDSIDKEEIQIEEVQNFTTSETFRSHILFTSGSTGKPKPVQISAQNIIHLATNTPITPLHPDDKVAEFNNAGFDLSLFEIWVTLLSGATIVPIRKEVVTDPHSLKSLLQSREVTVMMLSVALMEALVFAEPSVFSGLRHVLSAGDVASVKAMRAMFQHGPPENIWNTYGPTECTTLTTAHLVTEDEAHRDRISIGQPVGKMKVFLLDENLQPIVQSGMRGEIYISGPQQSPGYLGRPSDNEERFVDLADKDLKLDTSSEDRLGTTRLYRTGDWAEWRPETEYLDFIGRVDRQVKHRGFRVELEEIERLILSYEQVDLAVVIHIPPLTEDSVALLVAFVKSNEKPLLNTEDLFRFIRERLPFHMVPDAIETLDKPPLTHNGKIDRKLLMERYINRKQEDITERESVQDTDTESVLKDLWKEVLLQSHIGEDDDFVDGGASSLQNASLISLIQKRFGCSISMEDFLKNTQFRDMVKLIDQLSIGNNGENHAPDDTETWIRDIDLVDDISLVPDWNAIDEGKVFITGATGFVGANLLRSLIDMPTVKQIACLARTDGSLTGAGHIQSTMQRYDLWPSSLDLIQKLIVLEGDMEDQDLGLGPERFLWLTNWASVVFHLGAKVNFCESYHAHFASNVLGTKHVLRVAALGRRKAFHYMSSIDVWGPTGFILGTRKVLEDGPLQPHIQSLRYDLGYSASQWTAESMVRRMRDRGLPAAIYRPGYIIGNSQSGALNPNDFFSRLIVGCIQVGKFPNLDQNLEYCTIDYVISSMVHIASSNKNLGRSYSLLSPDPTVSISVRETCRIINEAGYPVELVSYPQWLKEIRAAQLPDGPLAPLMPMFEEKVLGKLTRWEASQTTPIYDSSNAVQALEDRPDLRYRPLDVELLTRIIAFWNRKGFYKVES